MPHKPSSPFSLLNTAFLRRPCLLPEETEAAVRLGVSLTPVDIEALRDRRLHLGGGTRGLGVDVRSSPLAAVHDPATGVHIGLTRGDEVAEGSASGPRGVDDHVVVEEGGEVLPFAGVAVAEISFVSSLVRRGGLPIHRPAFG